MGPDDHPPDGALCLECFSGFASLALTPEQDNNIVKKEATP